MPIKMAEYVIIKELSDKTTSVRPLQDQLRTVNKDRPDLDGYNVHQWYQTFYSPTNAHVEFIKQIKIKKAAPTCFGLQGNHHQGASQRLTKITHLAHVDT